MGLVFGRMAKNTQIFCPFSPNFRRGELKVRNNLSSVLDRNRHSFETEQHIKYKRTSGAPIVPIAPIVPVISLCSPQIRCSLVCTQLWKKHLLNGALAWKKRTRKIYWITNRSASHRPISLKFCAWMHYGSRRHENDWNPLCIKSKMAYDAQILNDKIAITQLLIILLHWWRIFHVTS